MARKSTKKLRERGNGFKNVKPRPRMNAKKAGTTDRGTGPWAYGKAWR